MKVGRPVLASTVAALLVVACGASSTQTAATTPSPSPAASPSQVATPSLKASAQVPKKCAERLSESQVSNALGKNVTLLLESGNADSLVCGYDVAGATPNHIAYAGRISFIGLLKDPSQADVDAFVAQLKGELGAEATVQTVSGVGDYAGWVTLTLPNSAGTVWDLAASKGRLFVDFSTWSGAVRQPNQSAMADVVRAALG